MKKHLILSTCLVSLTTSPLLASEQQPDIEEQQRILTQCAVRVAEKQQENEAFLNALLSNPDLATTDEIQKLSPDLQIEYFIRLTAKEEQARASSASTPYYSSSSFSSTPQSIAQSTPSSEEDYDEDEYIQARQEFVDQTLQDLLRSKNPNLTYVPADIVEKYFTALEAKQAAPVIISTAPSTTVDQAAVLVNSSAIISSTSQTSSSANNNSSIASDDNKSSRREMLEEILTKELEKRYEELKKEEAMRDSLHQKIRDSSTSDTQRLITLAELSAACTKHIDQKNNELNALNDRINELKTRRNHKVKH